MRQRQLTDDQREKEGSKNTSNVGTLALKDSHSERGRGCVKNQRNYSGNKRYHNFKIFVSNWQRKDYIVEVLMREKGTFILTCFLAEPILITKLYCFINLYCVLSSTEPGDVFWPPPRSLLVPSSVCMFHCLYIFTYICPGRSGHSF